MNRSGWYADLSKPAPVPEGTRIRLTHMALESDGRPDPCPIEVGTTGTVTGGNAAQLYVDWDNGRTLILCLPNDTFEVIS